MGHDTNLANIAGMLNLLGLWTDVVTIPLPAARSSSNFGGHAPRETTSCETYYSAQTLEQMRSASNLTPSNPPQRVHIYLPGCSRQDTLLLMAIFFGKPEASC